MKKEEANLPDKWEAWCKKGKYSVGNKRRAVTRCIDRKSGDVRGYFSDLKLDPGIDYTESLYPSIEHETFPKDDKQAVVESRIVNDMKSHLDEEEFWKVVEHLYAVGVEKGEIPKGPAKRWDGWAPKRHYRKT